MEYTFRSAEITDLKPIWAILEQAILRRKADGSKQWQDGYPNPDVIQKDIECGTGFVLTDGTVIIGYVSVVANDEPEYARIEGEWLSNGDFVVAHRIAIAENYTGKGLAKRILGAVEDFAVSKHINSVKVDTNFDNIAMIKTFEKLGYIYCGEVYFRGSARRAYEKVLSIG